MEVKAGILAIGNEVVEGQITNSNASWLSRELNNMGVDPILHLSCTDTKTKIKDSLDFLNQHCSLILASGGLGPTCDDITRESLSQWIKTPLEFHEDQWQIIKKKLEKRGVILRQGHKNQAKIPKGAKVLANDKGVAPGFFIKTSRCFLASLPGPPFELKPMFKSELKNLIQIELTPKKNKKLYTWACLGVPESEVAHKTENILGNSFEKGFRVHKPYVEIKVWAPLELSKKQKTLFSKLEETIKDHFVGYSILEIRKNFHERLKHYNTIHVLDHLTSGLFLEKLNENFQNQQIHYQCFGKKSFRYFTKNEVQNFMDQRDPDPKKALLGLFPKSDRSVFIGFNGEIQTIELIRYPVDSHFGKLYVIEKVFLMFQ